MDMALVHMTDGQDWRRRRDFQRTCITEYWRAASRFPANRAPARVGGFIPLQRGDPT